MKLKATIGSLDEVDAAYRDLYSQEGDSYVLDVDDGTYKAKLGEFRSNNIELSKKLENLDKLQDQLKTAQAQLEKFQGVDPDKARQAMERIQELQDKQLLDEGKIEELLLQRTERMRADFDGKTQALAKDRDQYKNQYELTHRRLTEHLIDNSLQGAVAEVAVPKRGAMRYILTSGRDVWSLDEEGNPVPRGADGKVLYGKDGNSPLTMQEWAQGLVQQAAYLFEDSAGGGAAGNRGNSEGRVVSRDDSMAVGDNLEAIANGTVRVQ